MNLMDSSISRRHALQLGTAAAAAVALAPLAGAAPVAKSDSFTIALISDTHLGRGGEVAADQFKAAVAEINASDAEFTICCGDLVNGGGTPANEVHYPKWMEIAGTLKKPWHAVPGNHDPDRLFVKHISPQMDYVIDRAPLRFICFRDADVNPGHQGIVTPEQVRWIQSRLDDARRDGRRAILVSHVIYHENHKPDQGWMITTGREAFTTMLEANSKTIDAMISGHHHVGLRTWSDTASDGGKLPPIHEIVLPSNCWNFDRDLSAAPGFSNPERRPGYVLARLSPGAISLEYKALGQDVSVKRDLLPAG
jgi:predicted phosphodiesterase